MKLSFTIFLLLSCIVFSSSQNCLPNGITFSNQSELDVFATNYPACSVIEGNVTIDGLGVDDLSGLNQIDTIYGNLTIINCTQLNSLTGLEELDVVGGAIEIRNNEFIVDLNGLQSCPILSIH